MNKINFQNLPSTSTPVNATNLNQLQTNVENALNLKLDKNIVTYSGNLNDISESGVVYAGSSSTNKPASSNGYCITLIQSSSYKKQIFYEQGTNDSYERILSNNVWRDWVLQTIESGSNANGDYIKYPDGTMICYKNIEFTNVGITSAMGNLYISSELSLGNYAQQFTEAPNLQITIRGGSSYCFVYALNSIGKNVIGNAILGRGSELSSGTIKLSIQAIGKWK